jgi:uncharacterized membrane protein
VFGILFALLVAVVGLVFFGVVGLAFSNVGFTPWIILLILACTLLGSAINVPVLKIKTHIPMVTEDYVDFFGVAYRVPRMGLRRIRHHHSSKRGRRINSHCS